MSSQTQERRTEYTKINGVRVNVEKYGRKLRKIMRLEGTVVQAKQPGKWNTTVHSATRYIIPPSGRQVYPRIGLKLKCGGSPGRYYEETYAVPNCKRCRRSRK